MLADPATIAGVRAPTPSPVTTRARRPSAPAAPEPAATRSPIRPRTALLEATRSRRLAREARLRERDGREALIRSRQAFEGAATPAPAMPASPVADTTRETSIRWQRRALVATPAPQVSPNATSTAAPAAPSLAERALKAELREARATLAIARETAQLQRHEIARLRQQLQASTATPPAPVPTVNQDALHRLTQRVQTLEAELDVRASERARLLETLSIHERERAERARQLDALNDRLDVQAQALDRTRRELEQERRRHTEAQALLTRLRAALHGLDDRSAEAGGAPTAGPALALETADAPLDGGRRAPDVEHETQVDHAPPGPPPSKRPAIFDDWRESQIRRHFGAFGIDGTADLLRDPMTRRASTSDRPLPILLLGPGSRSASHSLAEALLRGRTAPFVLHVADPCPNERERARDEDPLAEVLRTVDYPAGPSALAALVRSVEPAVIVSRDCLTGRADLTSWLEVFENARASQTCLVFLEETGEGGVELAPELAAIGERIWALLPDRYTREPAGDRAVVSFREAFARRRTAPGPSLLAMLRDRFELELFAQFGLLAEAFVAGPVAGRFDPSSARDRRFLEQIAELDDRRVEAGAGPALHLVARVDPLSSR